MEPRIKQMATLFWELDLVTPAAARLMADIAADEPLSLLDLAALSREMSDTPSFFGGPEKNRPRHLPDIQRSPIDAIPN